MNRKQIQEKLEILIDFIDSVHLSQITGEPLAIYSSDVEAFRDAIALLKKAGGGVRKEAFRLEAELDMFLKGLVPTPMERKPHHGKENPS